MSRFQFGVTRPALTAQDVAKVEYSVSINGVAQPPQTLDAAEPKVSGLVGNEGDLIEATCREIDRVGNTSDLGRKLSAVLTDTVAPPPPDAPGLVIEAQLADEPT
jgi:hypothetical protein